jgi:hypothetical protein
MISTFFSAAVKISREILASLGVLVYSANYRSVDLTWQYATNLICGKLQNHSSEGRAQKSRSG